VIRYSPTRAGCKHGVTISGERYYRDVPLLIIGGGTNELQKLVIPRGLQEIFGERF